MGGIGRRRRWSGAIVIVAIAAAPAFGAAARFQSPGDPSPASVEAAVIAQGVAPLAGEELVWRIVRGRAAPPANAATVDGQVGFLVADQGVMLVEEEATGEQARLAGGEAMLTRTGDAQVRAALGPTGATYYALEVVPAADAENVGAGEVLFVSEAFAGPNASHDLDLVRDVLAPGEATQLPDGAAPTALLVTAGAADVTTADGTVVRVGAGEAAAFDGVLTVAGAEEGATLIAGYVGPAVPRLRSQAAPAASPVAEAAAVAPSPPGSATPETIRTLQPEETPAAPTLETGAVATIETPEAAAAAAEPDADADGLSDAVEANLNTDPAVADTDGDGLTDGEEVNSTETEPLAPDSDSDGILDGDEVAQGSNPLDANSPGVAAEAPPPAAPVGDSDGDGLPDEIEAALGTDPFDIDTDGDEATDGDEYYVFQTGTLNPDTDGDGYLDGIEVINGTDPNDPTSFPAE